MGRSSRIPIRTYLTQRRQATNKTAKQEPANCLIYGLFQDFGLDGKLCNY